MSNLFFMGEYGQYVWPAFGVTAFIMIRLIIVNALRMRNLNRQLVVLELAVQQVADSSDET